MSFNDEDPPSEVKIVDLGVVEEEEVPPCDQPCDALNDLAAEVVELKAERDRYKKALESASCELGSVIPDRDCKCHQNPPCNWCYEWGLYADLVSDMKKALGGE